MKTISQTEKIKAILNNLCIVLQAEQTDIKKESYSDYQSKRKHYTIIFNTFNFDNIDNVTKVNDIKIQVTKECIYISNDNFNLTFAPDQLLTVKTRFDKIKELK